MDHVPTDDETLVLAMPAREMFAASGFVSTISMAVLDSLGDETWFALPSALAEDLMAREVRLGVMVVRGAPGSREALVATDGRLLDISTLAPEQIGGSGLALLKRRAMVLACALAGLPAGTRCGVELAGYVSDGRLPGLKHAVILVYRAVVPPETPAPGSSSWIRCGSLAGVTTNPLCALVVPATDPRPA